MYTTVISVALPPITLRSCIHLWIFIPGAAAQVVGAKVVLAVRCDLHNSSPSADVGLRFRQELEAKVRHASLAHTSVAFHMDQVKSCGK
jgi:hypothetical protein